MTQRTFNLFSVCTIERKRKICYTEEKKRAAKAAERSFFMMNEEMLVGIISLRVIGIMLLLYGV